VYDSVEHYSNEWKRCRNLLKCRFGGVMVIPGLPLTGLGIEDRTAIRGLVDIGVWFSVLEEHELKFLRNTRKGWEDIYLGKRKRGAGWSDYRLNIRLPVSLKEGGGTTPSFSEGWGDRQEAIPRLTEAGERYWITMLVDELNRELRFGLARAVSVGRTLLAVRRQEQSVEMGRVATLGASNAGKTAAALEEAGVSAVRFGRVWWRPTTESVKAVIEEMELELAGSEVLILQCMDNNSFFVLDEETGSMTLPALGEKNIYHAAGPLVVAKDQQLDYLLNKLAPIMEWRPEMLIILITPWCRYLTACCEAHPKGLEAAMQEGATMLRGLGDLRRKVKTWLVFNKHTNVVVLDPLATFKTSSDVSAAMAMMADTVHLKDEGYQAVAARCKQIITEWLLKKKRKAAAMAAAGNDAKKPRLDNQTGAGSSGGGQSVGGGQSGGSGRKSNQPVGKGRKANQPVPKKK
jgi:hypothetical protein